MTFVQPLKRAAVLRKRLTALGRPSVRKTPALVNSCAHPAYGTDTPNNVVRPNRRELGVQLWNVVAINSRRRGRGRSTPSVLWV